MDQQVQCIERELKFAGVDHDDLRSRLDCLGAEHQGTPSLEDNWVYDKNGQLRGCGNLLRLRLDRRGGRITFKGPATFESSVKVRIEHETVDRTPIGDFAEIEGKG